MAKKNNGYTFNLANNTITLSRSFLNSLNSGDEATYSTFMKLQKDFPRLTIINQPKIKRKNKTQITYKQMEDYIKCYRDSEALLVEFKRQREASIGSSHSPYNFVRDWFMETFPNYKKPSTTFDENGKLLMDNVVDFPVKKEA